MMIRFFLAWSCPNFLVTSSYCTWWVQISMNDSVEHKKSWMSPFFFWRINYHHRCQWIEWSHCIHSVLQLTLHVFQGSFVTACIVLSYASSLDLSFIQKLWTCMIKVSSLRICLTNYRVAVLWACLSLDHFTYHVLYCLASGLSELLDALNPHLCKLTRHKG